MEHLLEQNDGAYDEDDIPINGFAELIGEVFYDEDCVESASYDTAVMVGDALPHFTQGRHMLSMLAADVVSKRVMFVIVVYGHEFSQTRQHQLSRELLFACSVDLKDPMFGEPI